MKTLTHSFFVGALCLLPFTVTAQTPASQKSAAVIDLESGDFDHALAFEKMKGLVGTYDEVDAESKGARVDYTLISRGSALVENWTFASGKGEMTVFHMDNGILIATHYCASGIQSTMKLAPSSTPEVYDFTLRSATNLPNPDRAHNSGFGYTVSNLNRVDRTEIWTSKGEKSKSMITMNRRKDPAP